MPLKRSKKSAKPQVIAFSDDDEEDDSGEDIRPAKKKFNPFIDEMAIVDDDEDDEDDDEDYGREDGFIEEENDDILTRKSTTRRHLDLDRRREMEGLDEEQVAAFYTEKYGGRNKVQSFKDTEEVPQQLLLPSTSDPNLFMVKCKPGKERDVIFGIMKRYFDRQKGNRPLEALSAFARETLKGYIYIEARKLAYVQEALQNNPNIYITTLMLVPIKDMVDTISVHKKEVEIPLGGWVRIKRGIYAGDLAQVIEVSYSQDSARVKVVPRLNLDDSDTSKDKKKVRAPARLFNPEKLANRAASNLQKKGAYWFYNGDHYHNGYLEKYFKVVALQVEEVNPSLDEIARFSGKGELNGEEGERNIDLATLSSLAITNAQAATVFQPGDVVTVIEGDMINLWGTVDTIKGSSVTIALDGVKKLVNLPAKHLRKKFNAGDHVKVIYGRYKDESSMVLNVHENIVTLLSDTSMKEVRVFTKDLREAAEVLFGKTVIGNYELHDLVQLDFHTVGVIVKVNRDSFQVLTQNGEERTVYPHQITNKKETSRSVSTDVNGNSIRSGDTVLEIGDRRNCSVLHLFRHFAFLHSRERTEHFGVWVVNRSNIVAAATRGRVLQNPSTPVPSSNNHNRDRERGDRGGRGGRGRGGGRGGFMGRGRRGEDYLVAKTVRIAKGPHKGYIGIVKDTTETTARVELHTNSKVLNLDKSYLVVIDSQGNIISQATSDRFNHDGFARPIGTPNRFGNGGMTPINNSGARTPAWNSGSRTPAWNSGSKTPAWNSGARTPNPYPNDGGRTPAWDSGSKTPLYTSNSSAWDNNSSSVNKRDTSRNSRANNKDHSSSRSYNTPHVAKTPVYSGGSSGSRFIEPETAPTPGSSWTAPTPAASFDTRPSSNNFTQTRYDPAPTPYEAAPTPGAGLIPSTPGGMLSAPTPGNYIPSTPGNYIPTTPGMGIPQTPFMPSGGGYAYVNDNGGEEDNWPMEEIEVVIKRSHGQGQRGQHAKIMTVNRNSRKCLVSLMNDSSIRVDIPYDNIELARPSKKDNVKIILGDYRGQLGSLVGVDSHDGIVKLRGDGSGFKILSMTSVAKYTGTERVE